MKKVNEDYFDGYVDAYLVMINTFKTVERFKKIHPEITYEELINRQFDSFKETRKRPIHVIHYFRNNEEIMKMINSLKKIFKINV